MNGVKINYTVKDDNDITIELITSRDDISLISSSVTKNASDYTVKIITSNQLTGNPDALVVVSGVESSNDSGAKLMIIDWYSKLNGTGTETLARRKNSSIKVKT
ncbi:MAG: hypothetical protein AB8B53_05850 [Flavobacteriales bacterium]